MLAWLTIREKPGRYALPGFVVVVIAIGVLNSTATASAYAPNPVLGNSLLVLACVCSAGYLIALRRFSIGHLAGKPVTQLSGGQRQLTLLARALAQGARALVLDEPVTGLDFGHQAKCLEILRELCAEGYTCVMTTHFPDHALWVADRVLMLRGGRIVADGAPGAVVTGELLGRLYGVDISVFPIAAALRVCVPDRISRLCRDAAGDA